MYGLELGRSVQRTGAGHIVSASCLQLVVVIIVIVNLFYQLLIKSNIPEGTFLGAGAVTHLGQLHYIDQPLNPNPNPKP